MDTTKPKLEITPALIDSVGKMTREQRQEVLTKVCDQYESVSEAIGDVSSRLCETRSLIQLWRSVDPRTIPASKLKVLLRSYLK